MKSSARRLFAVCLSAVLVVLSPGLGGYQAFAVSVESVPSGHESQQLDFKHPLVFLRAAELLGQAEVYLDREGSKDTMSLAHLGLTPESLNLSRDMASLLMGVPASRSGAGARALIPPNTLQVPGTNNFSNSESHLVGGGTTPLPPGRDSALVAMTGPLMDHAPEGNPAALEAWLEQIHLHARRTRMPEIPEGKKKEAIETQRALYREWLGQKRKGLPRALLVFPELAPEVSSLPGGLDYEKRHLIQILEAVHDPRLHVIFLTSTEVHEKVQRYMVEELLTQEEQLKIQGRIHYVTVNDAGEGSLADRFLKNKAKQDEIQKLTRSIAEKEGQAVPVVIRPHETFPKIWKIFAALRGPNGKTNDMFKTVEGSLPFVFKQYSTKSGIRKLYKMIWQQQEEQSVPKSERINYPPGFEDIDTINKLVDGIYRLMTEYKSIRVMVKLNRGTSGDGNASLQIPAEALDLLENERASKAELRKAIFSGRLDLPDGITLAAYLRTLVTEGAVVEDYIAGASTADSPSGQIFSGPDGPSELSTYLQVLEQPKNIRYLGATFRIPDERVRKMVQHMLSWIGRALYDAGMLGRHATDFLAVISPGVSGGPSVLALEQNLRRGGTSGSWETAMYLSGPGVKYDPLTGLMYRADGTEIYHKVIDHDIRRKLKGMPIEKAMEIFKRVSQGMQTKVRDDGMQGVLYSPKTKVGAVMHFWGAIKEAGNVGWVILATTPAQMQEFENRLEVMLNRAEVMYQTGADFVDYKPNEGVLEFPQSGKDNLVYLTVKRDVRKELIGERLISPSRLDDKFQTDFEGRAFPNREKLLYTPERGEGVIFHPTGYTIVVKQRSPREGGDSATEQAIQDFQARIEPALKSFSDQVRHEAASRVQY